MVDFTRKVPNVSVPSSPQLRTNTGSTASDVISAIGFGLDVAARNKQLDAQQEQKEQQARLREATDAVVAFENQQDITGVKRERAVAAEIDRLSDMFNVPRLDLRTSVGQVRGRTTAKGIREELSSEEKAAQASQNEREATELQVSQDIAFLPGTSVDQIQSASDEELNRMLLNSQANKSIFNANQATMAQQSAQATSAEQARGVDVRQFTDNFLFHYDSSLNDVLQSQLSELNRNDPKSVQMYLDDIREARFMLPQAIRQAGRAVGLNLGTQEVNNIVSESSGRFDVLEQIAKREDFTTLSDQQLKLMTNDLLFNLTQSDDPLQVEAGYSILATKAAGVAPEFGAFTQAIKTGVIRAVSGNTQDEKRNIRTSMGAQGGNEKEIEAAERLFDDSIKSMYEPAVKDLTEQYKTTATNSVLNDFVAPRNKLDQMVRSGTFMAHLSGLASERGGEVISDDKKAEVLDAISPVVGEVLVSTISQFLRQPQDTRAIRGPGETAFAQGTGEQNFDIDPTSLRVIPKGNTATTRQSRQSKKMNNLIETTIKAYENLGASNEQIEQLKDEIRNVFGLVPTDQENTSTTED